MNKHRNKPNKWNEEQKRKAEQKYCWKVTASFSSYDEDTGAYDGGILEENLFDTIDEAMNCVEECATQNHEIPNDSVSNRYLWKERPSWVWEQIRINTVRTDTGSVDWETKYTIDRVERKTLNKIK